MVAISDVENQSLLFEEQASAPAAPSAGFQRVYVRTSDHHLVREDSGSTVVDIEAGGGGGGGTTIDYLHYRDEKTSGTDGGTFTSGAWRTRTLNTEVSDAGGVGSLSSNQITLPAGTYIVHAWAPAYSVAGHRLRLQNITDTATILLGSSTYSVASTQSHAQLMGRFVLAGSKAIELQHYCENTQATNGLGAGGAFAGVTEVFASIELWKVA